MGVWFDSEGACAVSVLCMGVDCNVIIGGEYDLYSLKIQRCVNALYISL